MSYRKPNKQERKDIAIVAARMQIVMEWTTEKGIFKGDKLIEMGWDEIEGKAIDPEETYMITEPVQLARNHFRRMCNAFKKSGVQGVLDYAKEVNDFIMSQKEKQNESVA